MIGEYIEISNGIQSGGGFSINGFEINATANLKPYEATIVARNNEVCRISGKQEQKNYELNVNFGNNGYLIKTWVQNNTIDSIGAAINVVKKAVTESLEAAETATLPKIYDTAGNQVGICELKYGGEGLNRFTYEKYTIENNELYAYELSPDTKQILYCIYNSQNQMVATISKKNLVVHGHSRYTIYACSDEWFKYAALITACWDAEFAGQNDGGTYSVTSRSGKTTLAPELHSKYNPTFIEQVKQKEGFNNLPENMQMVKDKVNDSKKASDVKFSGVIILIFIVVLILIFLFGTGVIGG